MGETSHSHGTLKGTVLRREGRTKQESNMMMMGSHVNQSSNGNFHQRHQILGRNTKFQKKETSHFSDHKSSDDQNTCDDDDEVGIEKRITALQRLVPGGESLGIDKLFEETAGYILDLQDQVKTMKVLLSFFEGLDKE